MAPRSFLIPRAGRLMGRRQLRRRVGSEVGTLLYVLGHLGSLLVRRGSDALCSRPSINARLRRAKETRLRGTHRMAPGWVPHVSRGATHQLARESETCPFRLTAMVAVANANPCSAGCVKEKPISPLVGLLRRRPT